MQSFISDSLKNTYANMFYDLHATFARPITIFKTAQETVMVTNPANNYLFPEAPFNSEINTVYQSGVVMARVLYGKKESVNPFSAPQTEAGGFQNQIRLEEGEVRLKLDPTGAALLAGCERVTFDGTIFNVTTSKRPHGLFIPSGYAPKFEDFYLKKLN